jgi:hypothetical protein
MFVPKVTWRIACAQRFLVVSGNRLPTDLFFQKQTVAVLP